MNGGRFIVGLGIALTLAGSAGVWYWALYWPKPVAALDAKYCGTFELFRYEPPEGQGGDDPIARGGQGERNALDGTASPGFGCRHSA